LPPKNGQKIFKKKESKWEGNGRDKRDINIRISWLDQQVWLILIGKWPNWTKEKRIWWERGGGGCISEWWAYRVLGVGVRESGWIEGRGNGGWIHCIHTANNNPSNPYDVVPFPQFTPHSQSVKLQFSRARPQNVQYNDDDTKSAGRQMKSIFLGWGMVSIHSAQVKEGGKNMDEYVENGWNWTKINPKWQIPFMQKSFFRRKIVSPKIHSFLLQKSN
jgi:hypothetical protein